VRAGQGGVSSPGTGRDSSTPTTAIHALSESDEDMAVPGEMRTTVELVSTVSTPDTLVVTVYSSEDESLSGQTVELSSDCECVEEVGRPRLGYRENRRIRSPTSVYAASDLRLLLSPFRAVSQSC
jgi:hypothetical protein